MNSDPITLKVDGQNNFEFIVKNRQHLIQLSMWEEATFMSETSFLQGEMKSFILPKNNLKYCITWQGLCLAVAYINMHEGKRTFAIEEKPLLPATKTVAQVLLNNEKNI